MSQRKRKPRSVRKPAGTGGLGARGRRFRGAGRPAGREGAPTPDPTPTVAAPTPPGPGGSDGGPILDHEGRLHREAREIGDRRFASRIGP